MPLEITYTPGPLPSCDNLTNATTLYLKLKITFQ